MGVSLTNRKFLRHLTIVGVLLVSRCGKILHTTIPYLLGFCDWILIFYDNDDQKTRDIIDSYLKKYPDRFKIGHSSFPQATELQEKIVGGLLRRFKRIQYRVRDEAWQELHRIVRTTNPIDLVIWPDSDEIFTNEFPEVLEEFWFRMPNKRSMSFRLQNILGNYKTLCGRRVAPHSRIFKYAQDLRGPSCGFCHASPIGRNQRASRAHVLIHLGYLAKWKRDWRAHNWKVLNKKEGLWILPKDIRRMKSKEIALELKRPYDLTIGQWLKKNKEVWYKD